MFALSFLLSALPSDYPLPVLVVQHRSKDQPTLLEEVLQNKCRIKIKQADEKELLQGGIVYIAPPDYHMLVETDQTISLSSDDRVLFSRPSINVLFESAAVAFREQLLAIILTGANEDGAQGIATVKKYGGRTIAQDPLEAQFPFMPKAAIATHKIDQVMTLAEMEIFLKTLIGTT